MRTSAFIAALLFLCCGPQEQAIEDSTAPLSDTPSTKGSTVGLETPTFSPPVAREDGSTTLGLVIRNDSARARNAHVVVTAGDPLRFQGSWGAECQEDFSKVHCTVALAPLGHEPVWLDFAVSHGPHSGVREVMLSIDGVERAALGLALESCGDGRIQASESCDDGNPRDGDGCSSGCVIEEGWVCSSEPSFCADA